MRWLGHLITHGRYKQMDFADCRPRQNWKCIGLVDRDLRKIFISGNIRQRETALPHRIVSDPKNDRRTTQIKFVRVTINSMYVTINDLTIMKRFTCSQLTRKHCTSNYRVAQKVATIELLLNRIKSYYTITSLDFFRQIKVSHKHIIFFNLRSIVINFIKYSTRYLIYDVK